MNPLRTLRSYCRASIAAVAIYVASHLASYPVPLESISRVTEVMQRTIQELYRRFCLVRESVIDGECLFLLGQDPRGATTGNLPPLAWPRPYYASTIWELVVSRLQVESPAFLIKVAPRLFMMLVERAYFNAESVLTLAALSIYLASYLKEIPVPCGEIAIAAGVSEADIRRLYALFYPYRENRGSYSQVVCSVLSSSRELHGVHIG